MRTLLAVERLTLLSARQVRFRELKQSSRLPQIVSPTTPIDEPHALSAERPAVIGVTESDRCSSPVQWTKDPKHCCRSGMDHEQPSEDIRENVFQHDLIFMDVPECAPIHDTVGDNRHHVPCPSDV